MKNKELYPGLGLVTPRIAKLLKELGWKWETPVILRVRTGELMEPSRYIDCNVGNSYLFIPSICQVIHWLELWGLKISYTFTPNFYGTDSNYTSPVVYDENLTTIKFLQGTEWSTMSKMMLDVIPHVLEYLKEILKEEGSWEMNGEVIKYYTRKHKYDWMLEKGNIANVKFYNFFSHDPSKTYSCDMQYEGL